MSHEGVDWALVIRRVEADETAAFVQLSRLVIRTLRRLRAFDFQDDWTDIVQEVISDLVSRERAGRLRDDGNVGGLIATITHRRFQDRLRLYYRRAESGTQPIDAEVLERLLEPDSRDEDQLRDVSEALAALEPKLRDAVVAVYVEGRGYQEAADSQGIPLGSFKRRLRDGLAELRKKLGHQP